MKKEMMARLYGSFEQLVKTKEGVEYWFARDLQKLLGYAEWRNFLEVIEKAIVACGNSDQNAEDHFVAFNKMVEVGDGAKREIGDVALTRYACYLIAQNGDPSKEPVAFAQTYFAVQTRKMELIERQLADRERLKAREKLKTTESELSEIVYERLGDDQSFGRIRSKGDQALFGFTTRDMKARLGVPENRPLADFLPTITIKAKDFATEITNFNTKKNNLRTEIDVTEEHVKNNQSVRRVLGERGIKPEALPSAEDAKKVERRLKSEAKKAALPPGKSGAEGGEGQSV
jgi:DNA-damage-inducible protein D